MKLTCWDYNGTIMGSRGEVRPNFAETLTDLRADGYANVVTTTIGKASVEAGLKSKGLDSLVDGIFGNRRKTRFDGKDYKDVLEAQKLPVDQASESVVVIGDNDTDHPTDLEKVVFIYNPDGIQTDARLVQAVLTELSEKGNSHFYNGFNKLKTADIDMEEEAGYIYHGQIPLQDNYTGVLLSVYNGNPWLTPTVLLIPESEAVEFEQFEVQTA